MKYSPSVAAVVVTYNRKALLLECIEALLGQKKPLHHIYLIDNASSDGTPQELREAGYLDDPRITYERLAENEGGAGGFHLGVKKAFEAGFDWIWVMDDDAEPRSDSLAKLFLMPHFGKELLDYSALCGVKLGIDSLPQYVHRGHFLLKKGTVPLTSKEATIEQEISYSSFVGPLINRKAIEKAGFPKKELFIWSDDVEYCQRLMRFGPILYRPDSVILHKDGVIGSVVPEKEVNPVIPFVQHWKYLCGFRNYIYLMRVHGDCSFFWSLSVLLQRLKWIASYDSHRWTLFRCYLDYWLQGMGLRQMKTIKPDSWKQMHQK